MPQKTQHQQDLEAAQLGATESGWDAYKRRIAQQMMKNNSNIQPGEPGSGVVETIQQHPLPDLPPQQPPRDLGQIIVPPSSGQPALKPEDFVAAEESDTPIDSDELDAKKAALRKQAGY